MKKRVNPLFFSHKPEQAEPLEPTGSYYDPELDFDVKVYPKAYAYGVGDSNLHCSQILHKTMRD